MTQTHQWDMNQTDRPMKNKTIGNRPIEEENTGAYT